MHTIVTHCNLFTGAQRVPGQEVVIEDGVIRHVGDQGSWGKGGRRVDLQGKWLAAGFVDAQVNGAGDELFQASRTTATLSTMENALRTLGVTAFLPTLTATTAGEMLEAAEAVGSYLRGGGTAVFGLNLEGPFINPAKAGMADPAQCRPLEVELIRQVVERASPGNVFVTVAPEVAGSAVEDLARLGAIVSVGHTRASYEEAATCLRRGAVAATHLFNAMSGLTGREPGVIAAVADTPGVLASIIADGYHLEPATARAASRLIGLERVFLISDGMPPLAGTVHEFRYGSHTVTEAGGQCLTEDGVLAGTAVGIAEAARNLAGWIGVDVARVVPAITSIPARMLRREGFAGEIRVGAVADLVITDEALHVEQTIVRGEGWP